MAAADTPGLPKRQRRTGVCSWSLRPDSSADLVEKVRAAGLGCVQLALAPKGLSNAFVTDTASALAHAGIEIRSGMLSMEGEDYSTLDSIRRTGGIRPDATWSANLERACGAANLAQTLRLPLVTFHAGFLPEDRRDGERAKLVDRLRTLTQTFAAVGTRVGLETGQESAATLLEVLDEVGSQELGVNFDPANMILYGTGDPVDAIGELCPRVFQVHVKDAVASARRGEWGEEVPVGKGAVDWRRFFDVLDRVQPDVDLMIERESGEARVDDVRTAREFIGRIEHAGSARS
jgi:sugar phosphate isomerase/epimerase